MSAAPRSRSGWIPWASGLTVLALSLGLAQAWCNMGRMDLAYEFTRQQAMLAEKQALADKLGVEHDSLLASHRLRSQAEALGLEPAGQGRIRVLERIPQAPADNPRGGGS